jgi:hypothetical protein
MCHPSAGSLREFQSSMSYPTGWWRQFTSLMGREFKSMTRNPFDVAARWVRRADCQHTAAAAAVGSQHNTVFNTTLCACMRLLCQPPAPLTVLCGRLHAWLHVAAVLTMPVFPPVFPPFFLHNLHACRIFTFTYVALLFGIMGYNVELTGLDGFNSINNMLFTTVLIMLLMPYVGISLYTADKTMYIADASARRYRASAYYVAKVGSGFKLLGLWAFEVQFSGFALSSWVHQSL